MLGIDVCDNVIRVVNVRRRGGRVTLLGAGAAALTAGESKSAESVGQKLGGVAGGAALEFAGGGRVMTLGRGAGFVRRLPAGQVSAELEVKSNGTLSRAGAERMLKAVQDSVLMPVRELVFDLKRGGARRGGRGG